MFSLKRSNTTFSDGTHAPHSVLPPPPQKTAQRRGVWIEWVNSSGAILCTFSAFKATKNVFGGRNGDKLARPALGAVFFEFLDTFSR
jgi:hypothetical protein